MLPCKMDEKRSGMAAKTLHHRWLTCQLLVVKKSGRCVYESVLQEKEQTPVVSGRLRQTTWSIKIAAI